MKKLYTLLLFLFTINTLFSQNNDAATALVVCNDPITNANPNGMGINDFADPDNHAACNGSSEGISSMWLFFKMDDATPPNTDLGFIINPLGGFPVDYDWAIYGPDVSCGALGDPIRCSSSSGMCGFCPQTGLGMGAMDVTEGPGTGDGFLKLLTVQAGEGYYIYLTNYTNNGTGFTLTFTDAGANYLDCAASLPCCINISTSNDLIVCAGADPFTISATATGGTNPLDYSWVGTNGGTAFLDDPNSQTPTVTIPPDFFGTIIYTVTASDGNCSIQDFVQIIVNPKPQVVINPVGILCTNAGTVQMTGTPQNGIWGGIANVTGQVNPFSLPAGTYEVTLKYTNQFGCKDSASIDVEIAAPEDIEIEDVGPLCIDGPPVQLMATPIGGTWSGPVENTNFFNPGNNGIGTFTLKYTFITPEGCKSEKSILIDVVDIPDVYITDPGILCADELIHNLDANPTGGVWSGVADPFGTIYPKMLGAGSFKVKYVYTDMVGCVNKDSIFIDIEAPPFATIKSSVEVCNSINSGKPTSIDFSTLILSGDNTGFWFDEDNSGASGSFPVLNFNGLTPGTYTFSYTVQSTSGACPDFVTSLQVTVIDCDCPSVSLNGPVNLCNSGNSVDLNTYKITTEPGVWSLSSVPPGSNPATLFGTTFNYNGKDQGVYIAKYLLSNTVPINCPSSADLVINLYNKPFATLPASIILCNQPSSVHPSVVDLYSLISGGDKTGTWVDAESSGASGGFNALDFTGIPTGTYTFTYTTASATPPCVESSYSIDIIVDDCKCPSIVLDPAADLCEDAGSIDLSLLSANSAPGNWSIKTKPAGSNPATLASSIFTTNNSDPGTYTLTYTLNPAPPAGCPDQKDIDVKVIALPFATLQSSIKCCNSSIISPDSTKIDFSTLVLSGDKSGSWKDINASGASGTFPVLDFSGVPPGNYTFEYTTGNAIAPCTNQSYTLTVIVKDCNCPDLSIVPSQVLCNDQSGFDLANLLLNSEQGTWSIVSNPAGTNPSVITGNTINVLSKDPGLYTLQFTAINTPPAGCPDNSQSILTLNSAPNAGTSLPVLNICQSTISSVLLSDRLNAEDQTGVWSLNTTSADPGTAFDSASGSLSTDNLAPGIYSFDYLVKGTPPCKDATSTITIKINPLFSFDAGQDQSIDCSVNSVTLGQTINLPSGYQISWAGPGIIDPANPVPDVKKPGKYIATVITDNNCVSSDSLTVSVLGNPITDVETLIQDASCPQALNGKIEVTNITGGSPQYSYSWNGATSTIIPVLDKLGAGNYSLHITDMLGCIYDTSFTVKSQNGFTLNLGPDLELDQGEQYSITAVINIAPNLVDSIIWFPAACLNCLQINEEALEDIVYKVIAYDINGCSATDEVRITVNPVRNVFIPNVFSPNADGINDVFFIQTGDGVKEIESMEIFNRWGSKVFSLEHFQPNDPNFGWNGKVNNKVVNSNVFVYWARIRFIDGEVFLYKGDITVHR